METCKKKKQTRKKSPREQNQQNNKKNPREQNQQKDKKKCPPLWKSAPCQLPSGP
jgi:hypothetical protein